MTNQELFETLALPFPTHSIKWRIGGGGTPLCYVDARTVIDRLNAACGAGGWQRRYPIVTDKIAVCDLGIKLPETGEWIWKSDGADPSTFEGEKGMLSDALKRAAVNWGVGLYLYDLKWNGASIDGKSIPKELLKELNHFHDEKVQEWGWDVGFRPGAYAFRLLGASIKEFVTDAALASEFRERNAGTIAQLPVRMRQRINELLDHVGAPQQEAAE